MSPVLALLAAAGLANVLGGLLAARVGAGERRHDALLAAVAGFLLAVVFLDMLPEVAGEAPQLLAYAFAGYLLVHLAENLYPAHGHDGPHAHDGHGHGHGPRLGAAGLGAAVAGLAVHSFFDGVTLAGAYASDPHTAVLVGAGIFLHSLPVGFALGSLLASRPRRILRAAAATVPLWAATLAGGLVTWRVGAWRPEAEAAAVAVALGTLLYIGATDMVPRSHAAGSRRAMVWSLLGAAGYLGLSALLERLGGH